MKTLDLNNYGVQEMKVVEMERTDGGTPLLAAVWGLVVGYVLIEAAINPTASVNAFKAGWDAAK